MADLGVLSAGKKLGKHDCVPVLRAALVKFEAKYPGAFDILFDGLSEKVKEKIRRAAGAKPPIDV